MYVSRQRSPKLVALNCPEKIGDVQKFTSKQNFVKTETSLVETDKIRANKMIRGSPIKHDQIQK